MARERWIKSSDAFTCKLHSIGFCTNALQISSKSIFKLLLFIHLAQWLQLCINKPGYNIFGIWTCHGLVFYIMCRRFLCVGGGGIVRSSDKTLAWKIMTEHTRINYRTVFVKQPWEVICCVKTTMTNLANTKVEGIGRSFAVCLLVLVLGGGGVRNLSILHLSIHSPTKQSSEHCPEENGARFYARKRKLFNVRLTYKSFVDSLSHIVCYIFDQPQSCIQQ
jgi:hypothetical protein